MAEPRDNGLPSAGARRGDDHFASLSGCYLLIVVGEPATHDHRDVILQKISKGFLSWDMEATGCCISAELQYLVDQDPIPEEAKNGEKLIQFVSENLVTEVLINPQVNTLQQCMKNLLSSYTKHKHVIHSGYAFAGSGSWILQDSTYSFSDFLDAFQDAEVQRIFKAYENCISIHVHCTTEGEWNTTRLNKEPLAKLVKVVINPDDKCSKLNGVTNFVNFLGRYIVAQPLEELLEPSDVVGNIRFSRPTLYVFPGGQGDSALFGVNGFNMLIDGGFNRKACFWDFARHLDRVDALLVTRVSHSNVNGVSSFLKRKVMGQVYPKIGHVFCNIVDRKHSPDGDKDSDSLLVSLAEEGHLMMENLRHLGLKPQNCYRETSVEPINLYHKVGHGKLDMFVLNPTKDSQEVKEFLQQWHLQSSTLGSSRVRMKIGDKELQCPLPNLMSICAILVWQPADPTDSITRILFPGSSPQSKIFEGLDKLRHLEILKSPVCSEKLLQSSSVTKMKTKLHIGDVKPIRLSASKLAAAKAEEKAEHLVKPHAKPERKHEPKPVPKVEEKKVSEPKRTPPPSRAEEKKATTIATAAHKVEAPAKKMEAKKATPISDKKPEPKKMQVVGGKVIEVPKAMNGTSKGPAAKPSPHDGVKGAARGKVLKEANNKKTVEEKNIAMRASATAAAAAKKEVVKKKVPKKSVSPAAKPVAPPKAAGPTPENKAAEVTVAKLTDAAQLDNKIKALAAVIDRPSPVEEGTELDSHLAQDSAEEEKTSVDEKQSLDEEVQAEKDSVKRIEEVAAVERLDDRKDEEVPLFPKEATKLDEHENDKEPLTTAAVPATEETAADVSHDDKDVRVAEEAEVDRGRTQESVTVPEDVTVASEPVAPEKEEPPIVEKASSPVPEVAQVETEPATTVAPMVNGESMAISDVAPSDVEEAVAPKKLEAEAEQKAEIIAQELQPEKLKDVTDDLSRQIDDITLVKKDRGPETEERVAAIEAEVAVRPETMPSDEEPKATSEQVTKPLEAAPEVKPEPDTFKVNGQATDDEKLEQQQQVVVQEDWTRDDHLKGDVEDLSKSPQVRETGVSEYPLDTTLESVPETQAHVQEGLGQPEKPEVEHAKVGILFTAASVEQVEESPESEDLMDRAGSDEPEVGAPSAPEAQKRFPEVSEGPRQVPEDVSEAPLESKEQRADSKPAQEETVVAKSEPLLSEEIRKDLEEVPEVKPVMVESKPEPERVTESAIPFEVHKEPELAPQSFEPDSEIVPESKKLEVEKKEEESVLVSSETERVEAPFVLPESVKSEPETAVLETTLIRAESLLPDSKEAELEPTLKEAPPKTPEPESLESAIEKAEPESLESVVGKKEFESLESDIKKAEPESLPPESKTPEPESLESAVKKADPESALPKSKSPEPESLESAIKKAEPGSLLPESKTPEPEILESGVKELHIEPESALPKSKSPEPESLETAVQKAESELELPKSKSPESVIKMTEPESLLPESKTPEPEILQTAIKEVEPESTLPKSKSPVPESLESAFHKVEPESVLPESKSPEPETLESAVKKTEPELLFPKSKSPEPESVEPAIQREEPESVLSEASKVEPESLDSAVKKAEPELLLPESKTAGPESLESAIRKAEPESLESAVKKVEPEVELTKSKSPEPESLEPVSQKAEPESVSSESKKIEADTVEIKPEMVPTDFIEVESKPTLKESVRTEPESVSLQPGKMESAILLPESKKVESEIPPESKKVETEMPSESKKVEPEIPPESKKVEPEIPPESKKVESEMPSESKKVEMPSESKKVEPEIPPESKKVEPEIPPESKKVESADSASITFEERLPESAKTAPESVQKETELAPVESKTTEPDVSLEKLSKTEPEVEPSGLQTVAETRPSEVAPIPSDLVAKDVTKAEPEIVPAEVKKVESFAESEKPPIEKPSERPKDDLFKAEVPESDEALQQKMGKPNEEGAVPKTEPEMAPTKPEVVPSKPEKVCEPKKDDLAEILQSKLKEEEARQLKMEDERTSSKPSNDEEATVERLREIPSDVQKGLVEKPTHLEADKEKPSDLTRSVGGAETAPKLVPDKDFKAGVILSPIPEDAPKLAKPREEFEHHAPLAEAQPQEAHFQQQQEFLRTPDEVADLPIHEEVPTEFEGYYHIRGPLHGIPEALAEHDDPLIHDLKRAPPPLAPEEDRPEVTSDHPVDEEPLYVGTLNADHAEIVTLSNGTSPSTPLSPKSPKDKEAKSGEGIFGPPPTSVSDRPVTKRDDKIEQGPLDTAPEPKKSPSDVQKPGTAETPLDGHVKNGHPKEEMIPTAPAKATSPSRWPGDERILPFGFHDVEAQDERGSDRYGSPTLVAHSGVEPSTARREDDFGSISPIPAERDDRSSPVDRLLFAQPIDPMTQSFYDETTATPEASDADSERDGYVYVSEPQPAYDPYEFERTAIGREGASPPRDDYSATRDPGRFHLHDAKAVDDFASTHTQHEDGPVQSGPPDIIEMERSKFVEGSEAEKGGPDVATVSGGTPAKTFGAPPSEPSAVVHGSDKEYEGYYEVHDPDDYHIGRPAGGDVGRLPSTSPPKADLDIVSDVRHSLTTQSGSRSADGPGLSHKELISKDEKDEELIDERSESPMPTAIVGGTPEPDVAGRQRSETFVGEPHEATRSTSATEAWDPTAPKSVSPLERSYHSDYHGTTYFSSDYDGRGRPPVDDEEEIVARDAHETLKTMPDVTQSPMHSGSYVSADDDTEDDFRGHGYEDKQSDADSESPYHRPGHTALPSHVLCERMAYQHPAGTDSTSDDSDADVAHRPYGRGEHYYDPGEHQQRRAGEAGRADSDKYGGGRGDKWDSESPGDRQKRASPSLQESGRVADPTSEADVWDPSAHGYGPRDTPPDYGGYPTAYRHRSSTDSDPDTSPEPAPEGFEMDSPEVRHTPFQFAKPRFEAKHYREQGQTPESPFPPSGGASLSSPGSVEDRSSAQDDHRKPPTKTPFDDWGEPMGLPSPPPPPTNEATERSKGKQSAADRKARNVAKGTEPKKQQLVSPVKNNASPLAKVNGKLDDKEGKKDGENKKGAADKSARKMPSVTGSPKRVPSAVPKSSPAKAKRPDSPLSVGGDSHVKSAAASNRPAAGGAPSETPVYVDLTYIPHHGNPFYCDADFFRTVRARYYVFSGTNPSKEVFNALLEAKQSWENPDLEVTIIPTYDTDTLGYWFALNEDELAKHKIDLAPSASRCTINLQDHETSCSAYRLEF